MYIVLPHVLVPRYAPPSVATNYISKQVGNTYQKFNMHGTFQIMLNDIMSVYTYAWCIMQFGKDSQLRPQALTLNVVHCTNCISLSMSYIIKGQAQGDIEQ